MPRWRPPSPRSSPYITPAGYRRLEQDLKDLWERRVEVTRALAAAAAEGDRSENAEYIYRKKELRGIDARIRYLQKRLPALKVVDRVNDPARVYFGARVTLEDEAGREVTHRIVGADELDFEASHISVDSPLARVLLGRGVDEEVAVETVQGRREYVIVAVAYD
jgi:transcription elongation factor GreB